MNVENTKAENLTELNSDTNQTDPALSNDSILLKSLAIRLSAGDQSALEELYLMLFDHFSQFISSIIRSPDDASDLTQEVFMYLWENREKFSDVRNIKAYMYSIARTQAYRFIRSRATRKGNRSLDDFPVPEIGDIAPDDIMIASETKLLIALTLESLPEEKKAVFEMKRYQGLSYEEIAAKLNLKKRTVESYMYDITRELKKMLLLAAVFFTDGFIK